METETRYKYLKQIKELQEEIYRLRSFRRVVKEIGDAIGSVVGDNKSLNTGWLIKKIMELL